METSISCNEHQQFRWTHPRQGCDEIQWYCCISTSFQWSRRKLGCCSSEQNFYISSLKCKTRFQQNIKSEEITQDPDFSFPISANLKLFDFQSSGIGSLPKNDQDHGICVNPCSIVFSPTNIHSRTCRVLLAMAVPGHFLFAFTISFLQAGHTTTTSTFYAFYLLAAVIQIWILLCSAHWMVLSMWKNQTDPDNASIPYLTALGDLLGGALLFITFEILYLIGDRDSDVGD